ncbi:FUSC family protein [Streptomyces sp. NPDC026672]|uniref:FUSC family protein n=1 Tax=unclassified Streptomyces TaxID=2593676 RepID=UPI0033C5468E
MADGHHDRLASRPAGEPARYGESGFEPAVRLFAGAIPGSTGTVSKMLADRTGPWWVRLSLTTRQAVQVAVATGLAVALGNTISGQRYPWAVLACYLAFTGTATAAQTARKAAHRVLGTLVGLCAAVPLAAVTSGRTEIALPLMLVSIFAAFYVLRLSYALMTFFITLMLGEMFAVLGTYTPDLMLLRLEETALGGAVGIAVALLVLPVRTRSVTLAARRALLGSLRELMEGITRVLRDPAADRDLSGASRALDARLHQLLLLGTAFLRPAPLPRNGAGGRRLMIYTTLAHHSRGLARLTAEDNGPRRTHAHAILAHVTERIVDLIDELYAEEPRIDPSRSAATTELLSGVDVGDGVDPRLRHFVHELGHLHDALVSLGGVTETAPKHELPSVPVLHGRVRHAGRTPASALLTLADTRGVQQDHTRTGKDGSYRLTATEPGAHLLICSPDMPGAEPVATWVLVGARVGVHDVDLPTFAKTTATGDSAGRT